MINYLKNPKIKVALVRGAYLNNFECQNYIFNRSSVLLTGISSLFPIHNTFPFKVIKLPSIADVPFLKRGIKFISNRIIGDNQILFGLEKYRSHFDIFHTADPHYYYSYQLAKLRHENKINKLIVTSWETIPFNNEKLIYKKNNKYSVMDNADHFLCYTEKAKKCLMREGVDAIKISLIYLGVDLSLFTMNQNKPETPVTVLFVGRLVEEKGIMDAYEAFKSVCRQNINIKLQIIGEGPMKHTLIKRITADQLMNRISIETKAYQQMPDVYNQSDILILPSKKTKTWEEQYGMVLIEAMASGLPIVTYNTGAIKEIVGKAGIICKNNDIQDLTRALQSLVMDKYNRVKIGTMGRRRASDLFDSKKTANNITELYQSVLNS